jgi:MoxR-like ATPase
MLAGIEPCLKPDQMLALQQDVTGIHVAPALIDYVQDLTAYTRNGALYQNGLSPRAALALLAAARAWAFIEGRNLVLPEDVQAVLPGVAGHRLRPLSDVGRHDATAVAAKLITAVPLP